MTNDDLLLAESVLTRSLEQLFNPHSSPDLRWEVLEWVYSDSAAVSFDLACFAAEVDPQELRELILSKLDASGLLASMQTGTMIVADKSRRVRS